MPRPIASALTSSSYGIAQPPCSNSPRTSSSGRPGACVTPSSVTLLVTTTLRTPDPHGEWSRHRAGLSLPIRTADGHIDIGARPDPGLFLPPLTADLLPVPMPGGAGQPDSFLAYASCNSSHP